MAESTIEWTKYTHNPWWGCVKIRPECANCYAEDWMNAAQFWGKDAPRRTLGGAHYGRPVSWHRKAGKAGKRELVFCMSMGDFFECRDDLLELRERTWRMIKKTTNLIWLLLTKRPYNFKRSLPWQTQEDAWPNVMLGVTAGTQLSADELVPILVDTPAAGRFISYEPALEEVDFGVDLRDIDWLIAGAERVRKRPTDQREAKTDWFRFVRDQCVDTETAFFFKQKMDGSSKISMPILDGEVWAEYPKVITDQFVIGGNGE